MCVAGGFLTKWTAPALFDLTVVAFLAWQRRLSLLWSWRHLVALGMAVGICGLWASVVVMQAGWPALRDTVLAEAAQRFAPQHVGKAYPWLESLSFPFVVLAANLPWSALALVACCPFFFRLWEENGRRLLCLLHCWTWPNLDFLEFAGTASRALFSADVSWADWAGRYGWCRVGAGATWLFTAR